jgi:hypothetical protein
MITRKVVCLRTLFGNIVADIREVGRRISIRTDITLDASHPWISTTGGNSRPHNNMNLSFQSVTFGRIHEGCLA